MTVGRRMNGLRRRCPPFAHAEPLCSLCVRASSGSVSARITPSGTNESEQANREEGECDSSNGARRIAPAVAAFEAAGRRSDAGAECADRRADVLHGYRERFSRTRPNGGGSVRGCSGSANPSRNANAAHALRDRRPHWLHAVPRPIAARSAVPSATSSPHRWIDVRDHDQRAAGADCCVRLVFGRAVCLSLFSYNSKRRHWRRTKLGI